MTVVLDKKYGKADSHEDLVAAILKLASDKNCRLMLEDEDKWKETKLKEIARLTRILKGKL